jgi:hypothetical protein
VIAEFYDQLRKYHQRTLDLAIGLGFTPGQEETVRDQIRWIRSRQQALETIRSSTQKLNLTAALEDVAPVVFPADPLRQAGLRLSWNVLSGDAHVLTWPVLMRADFAASGPPDRSTGLSVGIAGGQAMSDLAGWFSLAMCSLRCGWSLFDRRCEGR